MAKAFSNPGRFRSVWRDAKSVLIGSGPPPERVVRAFSRYATIAANNGRDWKSKTTEPSSKPHDVRVRDRLRSRMEMEHWLANHGPQPVKRDALDPPTAEVGMLAASHRVHAVPEWTKTEAYLGTDHLKASIALDDAHELAEYADADKMRYSHKVAALHISSLSAARRNLVKQQRTRSARGR